MNVSKVFFVTIVVILKTVKYFKFNLICHIIFFFPYLDSKFNIIISKLITNRQNLVLKLGKLQFLNIFVMSGMMNNFKNYDFYVLHDDVLYGLFVHTALKQVILLISYFHFRCLK